MKPRKQLIEAAIADGSMDRMNQLLSAVQILLCQAKDLSDEASDIMSEKGLLIGRIKKLHNDFEKCADRYFKEFSTLVETEKSKLDMFGDLESFDKIVRSWAKCPNGWKPKMVKTNKFCPKCGHPLLRSEIEGYAYQCLECDEDFYSFEISY